MRLIELIQRAVYPRQDLYVEVHDLEGNRYEPLQAGVLTKVHVIGGGTQEEVFVIKVARMGRVEAEQ